METLTKESIVEFLRKRAELYNSSFHDNFEITPCPHNKCGALVPPYAIDRILKYLADEIDRRFQDEQA